MTLKWTSSTASTSSSSAKHQPSDLFIKESSSSTALTVVTMEPQCKSSLRFRSLSSTWEKTDSDDEDRSSPDRFDEQQQGTGFITAAQAAAALAAARGAGSGGSSSSTSSVSSKPRRRSNSRHRTRRRRTVSESACRNKNGAARIRIITPTSCKIHFSGWVRGQPADVRWEVLDKNVKCVRIDVCNVAWAVPTTIAHRVPNDGEFHWKLVYWGMPIKDDYYVNIYDVSETSHDDKTVPPTLLARSERFAVIG